MKKLVLAAIFGIAITSCGTKESSTNTNSEDSTAMDNLSGMSPSRMDTGTTPVPSDSTVMKSDSAAMPR